MRLVHQPIRYLHFTKPDFRRGLMQVENHHQRRSKLQSFTMNNGLTIPALGYGVFQMTSAEVAEHLPEAIAAGYRHIDTANAYFNEAKFHGPARFHQVIFQGAASFFGVKFFDISNFSKSQFQAIAKFDQSEFHDRTYFADSTFLRTASFRKASFYDAAHFPQSEVNRPIDLSYSNFAMQESHTCINAIKASGANLTDAEFGVDFSKSNKL